ncbi:hypothetical protein [Mesorhizobium sp. M0767]|uniref:hypothetical protein n=1 Tax=Mesorhizobium sp. M0767 TaxID=2956995 RepID=UPI003334D470
MFAWLWPWSKAPVEECPVPSKPVIPVEPPKAPPVVVAPPPAPPTYPAPDLKDPYYAYRPLFNLMGKSEGTDKHRGYNETLGYGAYTGGDVDLVAMTLGEIDKLQTKMLAHPRNATNSSALGRYQIVRTTLRALKKALSIPDTIHFGVKTQDLMCLTLLNQRGLAKYLLGTLSEDKFMLEMAKEWASIPTPAGHGFYSNQSRTPVSPAQVRAVYAEVKRRIKG